MAQQIGQKLLKQKTQKQTILSIELERVFKLQDGLSLNFKQKKNQKNTIDMNIKRKVDAVKERETQRKIEEENFRLWKALRKTKPVIANKDFRKREVKLGQMKQYFNNFDRAQRLQQQAERIVNRQFSDKSQRPRSNYTRPQSTPGPTLTINSYQTQPARIIDRMGSAQKSKINFQDQSRQSMRPSSSIKPNSQNIRKRPLSANQALVRRKELGWNSSVSIKPLGTPLKNKKTNNLASSFMSTSAKSMTSPSMSNYRNKNKFVTAHRRQMQVRGVSMTNTVEPKNEPPILQSTQTDLNSIRGQQIEKQFLSHSNVEISTSRRERFKSHRKLIMAQIQPYQETEE